MPKSKLYNLSPILYALNAVSCGVDGDIDHGVLNAELVSTSNVLYEGSCSYLLRCDRDSRNRGRVVFGCESIIPSLTTATCSDTEPFITAPNKDYCGLPIQICKPSGSCVTADVREVSDVKSWEGSVAVLDKLGQPHSESATSCTGSSGTITGANVSMGRWDSTGAAIWPNVALTAGATKEIYFSPGVAGTHAIDFVNKSGVDAGGNMKFCWRSATSTWNCWQTLSVSQGTRRERLNSGSSDISYKFVITALKSTTFYWRFYTGW